MRFVWQGSAQEGSIDAAKLDLRRVTLASQRATQNKTRPQTNRAKIVASLAIVARPLSVEAQFPWDQSVGDVRFSFHNARLGPEDLPGS